MAQIAHGNATALTELFDATASSIYGMALFAIGDSTVAETAASSVFVELWRTAKRYDPESHTPMVWIQRIAIQQISRARRAAR